MQFGIDWFRVLLGTEGVDRQVILWINGLSETNPKLGEERARGRERKRGGGSCGKRVKDAHLVSICLEVSVKEEREASRDDAGRAGRAGCELFLCVGFECTQHPTKGLGVVQLQSSSVPGKRATKRWVPVGLSPKWGNQQVNG